MISKEKTETTIAIPSSIKLRNTILAILISVMMGCALQATTLPDTVLSDHQYTYDGDIDPVDFLNNWVCDKENYQYTEGYYLFLFENPEGEEVRWIEAIFITDGNFMHLVGYKYIKDNLIHFFILNPDTNHFEYIESIPSEIHSI